MKSNKQLIYQIEDLLEQIAKLEPLIAMHREANHGIEVKQYEALKLKFIKELLTLLINSNLNLAEPQTFPLVQQLLERLYPATQYQGSKTEDFKAVASALAPLLSGAASAAAKQAVVREPEAKYGK